MNPLIRNTRMQKLESKIQNGGNLPASPLQFVHWSESPGELSSVLGSAESFYKGAQEFIHDVPWLIALLVLTLIEHLVTSAPVPQSSVLYKLVVQPHPVRDPRLRRGSDPESMWPNGVFLPPDDEIQSLLDLHHVGIGDTTFQTLEDEEDPLLLTGRKAINVVTLLLSHGELFFDEIPHSRALLRYQQGRIDNGLSGDRLGSNRPESPFYRWKKGQTRSTPFL